MPSLDDIIQPGSFSTIRTKRGEILSIPFFPVQLSTLSFTKMVRTISSFFLVVEHCIGLLASFVFATLFTDLCSHAFSDG